MQREQENKEKGEVGKKKGGRRCNERLEMRMRWRKIGELSSKRGKQEGGSEGEEKMKGSRNEEWKDRETRGRDGHSEEDLFSK